MHATEIIGIWGFVKVRLNHLEYIKTCNKNRPVTYALKIIKIWRGYKKKRCGAVGVAVGFYRGRFVPGDAGGSGIWSLDK